MRRMNRLHGIAILAVLVVLMAGCQQDSPEITQDPSDMEEASPAPAADEPTVAVIESSLGVILADAEGRTVYLFNNDTGSESTCYDACEERWPPLLVTGDPQAGEGADQSLLGVSARRDGSSQVTYNGHPLYLFSGDEAAGDTNGQGVGGVWFAVTAEGEAASS